MKVKQLILGTICLLTVPYLWAQIGTVHTYHAPELNQLLYPDTLQSTATNVDSAIVATGYRIQIYSSNASRKAKEQAFQWQQDIEQTFPPYRAYVQYQAPFWKVRVGDFTHYAEAVVFSNHLKNVYPNEASEIIIVKEKQVKPIYFKLEAETDSFPLSEEELSISEQNSKLL